MTQSYYETMYILRPDIPEEEVESHVTKYRDLVTELPRVADGHVHAPRGTGLCTELLPDVARRPDAIVRRSA